MVANVGAPIFAPSPAQGQIAEGGNNITFMAVGVDAAIVAFAQSHRMKVVGHTLCWHGQSPPWMFRGQDGNS